MSADSKISDFARKLAAKRPARNDQHAFTAKSGREFVIKRLTGLEHEAVDGSVSYNDPGFATKMQYRRLAASLVSVDGEAVPADLNADELESLLDLLDGSETNDLMAETNTAFMATGAALKNSSTSPESDESPKPAPSE